MPSLEHMIPSTALILRNYYSVIIDFINIKIATRGQGGHVRDRSTDFGRQSVGARYGASVRGGSRASPEDRTDIAARVVCLIELFGEPGQHEVSARVAAIDWRYQALARLSDRPEFKNWSLPGLDGGTKIALTILEAAVTEPLIAVDGKPSFEADRFFNRLLMSTKEQGHG
jgi:hypothetical protein